jgi:hypothetical protein
MAILWATVFQDFLVIPCGMIFGGRNSPSFYMIPGELRAHVASVSDFGPITTDLSESILLATPPSPRAALQLERATRTTKTPVQPCSSLIPRVATPTPALLTIRATLTFARGLWAPSPTVSSRPTLFSASPWRTDGRHVLTHSSGRLKSASLFAFLATS